jgi:hypothetical protein
VSTPFANILREAVNSTPCAIGGAFAAEDGETVDFYSNWDRDQWGILTAHYGIVLRHVQSMLNTVHYGEAELLVVSHPKLEIMVQPVAEGYFAMIALEPPAPLATAISTIDTVARCLREEMG